MILFLLAQVLVEAHDGKPAPVEQMDVFRHDVIYNAILELLLKPSGIHRLVE